MIRRPRLRSEAPGQRRADHELDLMEQHQRQHDKAE
jgi:hypothetical protein